MSGIHLIVNPVETESSPSDELPKQLVRPVEPSPKKPRVLHPDEKRAIRREQCRANQARYRQKQMRIKRQLRQEMQRLEEEMHGLRLQKRSIRFERKTTDSPWTIVGEVFRLIEDGFRSPWRLASLEEMMKHDETRQTLERLQKSFAHDVAFGELRGINALMDQWRRYSLYFEEPRLELKEVKAVATNVMRATATLSVTITEFTLRCLFPHLAYGGNSSLDERLLNQRLDCKSVVQICFDKRTGRIVRFDVSVDWVRPLFRLLGSFAAVSEVLNQALITPSSVVGDIPRHLSFGSD